MIFYPAINGKFGLRTLSKIARRLRTRLKLWEYLICEVEAIASNNFSYLVLMQNIQLFTIARYRVINNGAANYCFLVLRAFYRNIYHKAKFLLLTSM